MTQRVDFQHVEPRIKQVMTPNTFNLTMDMVRDSQANQANIGDTAIPQSGPRDVTVLRVLNNTDTDLYTGSILGIDAPGVDPNDNIAEFGYDPSLKGVLPALSDHLDKFCVLLESVPKRDGTTCFIGDAAVCGVVPVLVKMTYEWHTFARIDEGQTLALVSDVGGYPILWMDTQDFTPPDDANGDPHYQGDDDTATYRLCLVAIGGNSRNIAPWYNSGTEEVGPHGLFRPTAVDTSTKEYRAVEGEQPSDTIGRTYCVNGSTAVDADSWGVYQTDEQVAVSVGDSTAPDNGDELGPKADHWGGYKGYPPMATVLGTIQDETDDIIVLARQHTIPPRRFKGTTTASVSDTDTTVTVDTIKATDGLGDPPDDSEWTVNKDTGFCLDSGVVIRFETDLSETAPSGQPYYLFAYAGPCGSSC